MTLISYMLTIWGIILWIFRAVITILYTNGDAFFIQPLNTGIEIAVIFATIPCMILVFKRNIIGAAGYMGIYVAYFGTAVYNTLNNITSEQGLTAGSSIDLFISILCIVIPVLTFLDILMNKHRKSLISSTRSTDWYYNNDEFDRKFDDRADRNQYKIR